MALLEWRNTPTIGLNASPSQRLLARRTRGIVATSSAKLEWEPSSGMWEKKLDRPAADTSSAGRKGSELNTIEERGTGAGTRSANQKDPVDARALCGSNNGQLRYCGG